MKVCQKCGKEYPDNENFCGICGEKLLLKEEKPKEEASSIIKEKPKKEHTLDEKEKILIGVSILGMIFLVLMFVLTQPPPYQSPTYQPPQPQQHCVDVQVPYETQEPCDKVDYYTENEPQTTTKCDDVPLSYKKTITGKCQQTGWFNKASYSCDITNLDTEGGNFIIDIGFVMKNGQKTGGAQSKYIYPQTSETFSYTQDVEISDCYCNEIQPMPTKRVCRDVMELVPVPKSRVIHTSCTVTKYKTEQKCS